MTKLIPLNATFTIATNYHNRSRVRVVISTLIAMRHQRVSQPSQLFFTLQHDVAVEMSFRRLTTTTAK